MSDEEFREFVLKTLLEIGLPEVYAPYLLMKFNSKVSANTRKLCADWGNRMMLRAMIKQEMVDFVDDMIALDRLAERKKNETA